LNDRRVYSWTALAQHVVAKGKEQTSDQEIAVVEIAQGRATRTAAAKIQTDPYRNFLRKSPLVNFHAEEVVPSEMPSASVDLVAVLDAALRSQAHAPTSSASAMISVQPTISRVLSD